MGMPAGTTPLPPENDLVGYAPCDPNWSGTIEKLPEWLQTKALEGQGTKAEQPQDPEDEYYGGEPDTSGIPF